MVMSKPIGPMGTLEGSDVQRHRHDVAEYCRNMTSHSQLIASVTSFDSCRESNSIMVHGSDSHQFKPIFIRSYWDDWGFVWRPEISTTFTEHVHLDVFLSHRSTRWHRRGGLTPYSLQRSHLWRIPSPTMPLLPRLCRILEDSGHCSSKVAVDFTASSSFASSIQCGSPCW